MDFADYQIEASRTLARKPLSEYSTAERNLKMAVMGLGLAGEKAARAMKAAARADRPSALIDAGPLMLRALEMVRDADDDCRRDDLPTLTQFARGAIDAAIARARGEV